MIKDKSKVIKNVYYMIAYAYEGLISEGIYKDIDKEEFENIYDLFTFLLSTGVGYLLKRGLYKEYIYHKDNLPVVRGKIDITGTINNYASSQKVISCEYDILSINNYLNQIIKTTSLLLLRFSSKYTKKYKDILKKEMFFFSTVDTLNPKGIQWSRIRLQRSNVVYRFVLEICRLVLDGMIEETKEGSYRLKDIIDYSKMHKIYEKFVLNFYKKEHPELVVNNDQINWASTDGYIKYLPNMLSDVTIRNKKNNRTLIIDAKYYEEIQQSHYDVKKWKSGNMYQIYTYVKNRQDTTDEIVSGLLLYASTEESNGMNEHYIIGGNKLSVMTLDLNCEFEEIKYQLEEILVDVM